MLFSSRADAQVEWRVTPGLGFYLPVSSVVDGAGDSMLEMKQVATLAAAIHVGVFAKPILVELGGAYSPSIVAVSDREGTRDISAGIFFGSVRALARLSSADEPGEWGLHAGIGLARVAHWGQAWESFTETSRNGALVSASLTHRLTGTSARVRLEASDYMYRSAFGHGEYGTLEGGLQHDLVWMLGMTISLGSQ